MHSTQVCSIMGCNSEAVRGPLCQLHYDRMLLGQALVADRDSLLIGLIFGNRF